MSSYAFDLSKNQHVAMRRLMAEIYNKFWTAVRHRQFNAAHNYAGMASALVRVCLVVLNDFELYEMCELLSDVLYVQLDYHKWHKAA
ncbi:hypothetical protein JQC92_18575 [Shewanella sp. 202IG2-18]|uniref:hypothetical protein n=1 Tax=Parashewanella hymeniacidonis TaxID=2807618 RepID=UPI0019619ECB|nr:hypothetical protein [Parashewanella hymeniacidonis]MBM7074014.1 hypothetical protein [Parashewanella hymeniacidonis]